MNFLQSTLLFLLSSISSLLTIYTYIIIGRCLLSFVQPNPYNPIVRFVFTITEPLFYFVRRNLSFLVVGGFDLSPIIIILGINFLQSTVIPYCARFIFGLV